MKYKPEIWREKLADEALQKKYGENWRVVKRAIKEYQQKKASR